MSGPDADLHIDRCEQCRGVWLDEGELGRTNGGGGDWIDPGRATRGLGTGLDCPRCDGAKLLEVRFAPAGDVVVDTCMKCHGLWLDSRELPRVRELLRRHRIEEKKKRLAGG